MILHRFHTVLAIIFFKIVGVMFATEVFARFTPLVDSQLYLGGAVPNPRDIRTFITNEFGSFLNDAGGPFFAHTMFALFSVVGLIYYVSSKRSDLRIVLCLLLPSSMVWTSIVGKEAIFSGVFVMLIVLWAKSIRENLHIVDWFLVMASLTVCWIFRPHYTLCVVWIFFSLYAIKSVRFNSKWFIVGGFFVYLTAIKILVWDKLTAYAFKIVVSGAGASRHEQLGFTGLSGDYTLVSGNFEIFLDTLPTGLIFGIVGPLPNELLERYLFIPFFIEGLLVLLAPFVIYCWGILIASKKHEKHFFIKVFWLCVFPAIMVAAIVHAPFGILNPGSAIRWRTNFEAIFYVAPLLLYIETIGFESKCKKNLKAY